MEIIGKIASAIASDSIDVVDRGSGNNIMIDFMVNGKKIGYMECLITTVNHLDEIFSESIVSDEDEFIDDDETEEFDNEYSHDLMDLFEYSDKVCELGMFEMLPKWRHKHLAKPCFLKGLDWIKKNKGGFKAFVGRALSQDMEKGLEQSNLIGFYESVGFDVIADYGDFNGSIIIMEI